MASKILSDEDLQRIERDISDFSEGLGLYGQNIQKLIQSIQNSGMPIKTD